MKKKLLGLLLVVSMSSAVLAGCGGTNAEGTTTEASAEATNGQSEEAAATEDLGETTEDTDTSTSETGSATLPSEDRSGNAITVPEEVNAIISMAPSTTQVLIDLGLTDKIVAVDTNSALQFTEELSADLPQFDMMAPDAEQIVALEPDIVFTSGMSGADTFDGVKAADICVADIPSSASIADIELDLQFIGDCVGASDAAAEIVSDMQAQVDKIAALGESIPEEERKSILYEISTPTADWPTIYSCGQGTYIDEMITLVGAINVAGEETDQWPALSEEAAIAMNPDVILTSDSYTPDVINTLLTLSGWESVTAIANAEVYLLDANRINQPNNHIVEAMEEIAQYVYPDVFTEEALAE